VIYLVSRVTGNLNVVKCARDGIESQTQLCIDKKIKGFPKWKIKGKLILGVLTLKELSKLTGFKNQGQVRGLMIRY